MKRYYVVSPEYGGWVGCGYAYDSAEVTRDVVEIEAETAEDALVLGVKLMRQQYPRGWHNREHDGNPYAGMLVELFER